MTLRVAVDFGTSSTCVAVSVHGREPQVLVIDGQPLMSSAVYVAPDRTVFVGQEAERHAAVDPSRYEPNPKRRVDDGELLLGSTVLPVVDAIRAVLQRATTEARRQAGGAPIDQLVLTHPADWGGTRAGVLRQAANGLAHRLMLIPEPVAAAVFHAASFDHHRAAGSGRDALAVLDLGGGTVDVSVVRRAPVSPHVSQSQLMYQVLATRGEPNFGGADIDHLLLGHVGELVSPTDPEAWRQLVEGRDLPERRRRRVLWQDVRGAKETLSRHTYTDIPLPSPFPDAHVTRDDLERLIAEPVARTADLVVSTIAEARLAPRDLAGIFLVGGSSRIPMVAALVHRRSRVIPTTLDQPETVVARGALRASAPDPAKTGLLAAEVAAGAAQSVPTGPHTSGSFPVQEPPGEQRMPSGRFPMPSAPLPVPARSRSALPWVVMGAVVLVVAVVAVLIVVLADDPPQQTPPNPQTGKEIAQYDYRFSLPVDWKQTGGDAQDRKVEIKPVDAVDGDDLVLVQETALTYDSDADRQRAVGKLRSDFESAGPAFSDLDTSASYAGKDVVYYRQRQTASSVDWYVVFQGNVQVSIGCQHTDAGQAEGRPGLRRGRPFADHRQLNRKAEVGRGDRIRRGVDQVRRGAGRGGQQSQDRGGRGAGTRCRVA